MYFPFCTHSQYCPFNISPTIKCHPVFRILFMSSLFLTLSVSIVFGVPHLRNISNPLFPNLKSHTKEWHSFLQGFSTFIFIHPEPHNYSPYFTPSFLLSSPSSRIAVLLRISVGLKLNPFLCCFTSGKWRKHIVLG